MRILITSNYKIGNETGSSHVTDLLAFNLAKKNNICYIVFGEKFRIKKQTKNLTLITIPSTEINSIAIPLITPDVAIKTESAITKFSPNIIHTQNSVLISRLVQIWGNQKKIPVITTFHHIPTQVIRHLFPQVSHSILTKAVEELYSQTSLKNYLSNINGVIALNENQKKEIRKVDKNIKIEIINNGLDLKNFKNIKPKNKLTKTIKFVFMGSYIERKNQEFLIEAFKYLPTNFQLDCYGKISSGKSYYEKISLAKPKNVNLNNYTDEIPKTLKKYNFFISASLKEVQSLAVIYAMSAGLPIIGLENETITELVNSSNGLKLRKTISPKKFAQELQNYVERINYKKVSLKVKKDSRKFDIQKVLPKIECFYNEVLQNQKIISGN